MNHERRFERDLREWLTEGPEEFPETSRTRTLARVRATSQRVTWRSVLPIPSHLRVAVAFVAVAIVVAVGGLLPYRSATVPGSASTGLAAQGRWSVGARAIAVVDDGIWYASDDTRTARKFDPQLGRDVITVPVDRRPNWVVVAAGSVWVSHETHLTTIDAPPQRLFRLDPATGDVIATFPTGPGAIAAGDGSIWLAGRTEILRIDPRRNVVVARIDTGPVGDNYAISVGEGAGWVASTAGVRKIDLGLNQVVTTVPGGAWEVTVGGGSVWAFTGAEVTRIDAASNDVVATIGDVPPLEELVWAGEMLWAVGPPDATEQAFLLGIDPATNRVASRVPLGNGGAGLAVGLGSVWAITIGEPTLWRFRLPGDA